MELTLCFSGGGYRAAVYHLGVLTFLNEVRLNEGGTLLDHVHTITSISGGALPAITHAVSEAEGRDREETFRQLYHKIVNTNIGDLLIERFDKDTKLNRGLVQTLADIYNERFFNDEKFEKILNSMDWNNGIHHFYADATDFEYGLPFRFQATATLNTTNRREPYGMIGNWRHRMSRRDAMNVRLADIMAASSCFPLVFEPIIYPQDFRFEKGEEPRGNNLQSYPLMDGGLIDNQGIEPAIHAADHMKDNGREMDMIMICDAGSTSADEEDKRWELLPTMPQNLFASLLIMSILSALAGIGTFLNGWHFASGVLLMLAVVLLCAGLLMRWVNRKFCAFISNKTKLHMKPATLWGSSLSGIGTFFKSRVLTAYRMTDVVMTGHMKKLWFRLINENKEWKNKITMNSLSLFSTDKTWKEIVERQKLSKDYMPDKALRDTATTAAGMKTTLWFTEEQKQFGIPEAIFACGRFTTCWNLLAYINRLKTIEPVERTDFQRWMIAQETVIKSFWDNFQADPLFNTSIYAHDE